MFSIRQLRPVAVALLVIGLAGCASEAKKSADIVDTAVSAGQFNTLVAAVKAADLVETLKGPGPFCGGRQPMIRIATTRIVPGESAEEIGANALAACQVKLPSKWTVATFGNEVLSSILCVPGYVEHARTPRRSRGV